MGKREISLVGETLAAGQDPGALGLSRRGLIRALLANLCSTDDKIKWRAVTALGREGKALTDEDYESGRDLLRRLAWTLNDESGGIGWGAAEAMAEIMVHHEELAREFAPALVSFITPEGSYLEHPPLMRGAVWGIGRLMRVRPELIPYAVRRLLPLLQAEDDAVRGLAAWALGPIPTEFTREDLEPLQDDSARFTLYDQGMIASTTVKQMAELALAGRDSGKGDN